MQVVQKSETYQEKKRCIQKKGTSSPRPWLGGLHHKKERPIEKANKFDKYREKKYMEQVYLFFLSLYPKILAIASGATPIGSSGRAPDDICS
jgi:hypothetical protein